MITDKQCRRMKWVARLLRWILRPGESALVCIPEELFILHVVPRAGGYVAESDLLLAHMMISWQHARGRTGVHVRAGAVMQ